MYANIQQQNGCSIEKDVYNQNPVSLLSPARDEKWKEAGGGKIMYIYIYIYLVIFIS